MLSFSGSLKIWVGLEPCDMRKGYHGLTALVTQRFGLEVTSGALFVFANRSRTRLKILYWDGTGLWLLSKRLEKGRFSWPEAIDGGQTKLALRPEALAMLTDGVQLRGARLLPWYEKSESRAKDPVLEKSGLLGIEADPMSDDREAQLLDKIAALEAENRFLREKIDLLVKRVFGSSSEQMNSAQLELEGLMGKADAPALAESGTAGAGSPSCEKEPAAWNVRRPRLPEHLPVEEEVIVPLEVQAAPEAFRRIGEEVSERLDYRPARYLRLRTVRPKFVSVENKALPPVVAPVGPQLAEKLQATPAMIAHVIVGKYADHMPLYRQAAILQDRHGLNTTRQTLCDWVMLGARWMRLIYEEVRSQVLAADYVQVDETPIRYIEPGSDRCQTGYFWTVHRPAPPGQPRGPSFYQWHASRASECLDDVLGSDFDAVLQCDGYAAYESHARKRGLVLAACWAHARRKFHQAKDYDPGMVDVLNRIARLYQIEERLRCSAASVEERLRIRQGESLPILTALHALLTDWQTRSRFLPRSSAGEAIAYTLSLWKKLCLFAHDGRIEIDNNLCENAIRPTAVGKKNWLFIGAEGAAQNSAILFTLISECRRLGLNPQAYLTTALTRLPLATTSDVAKLTPLALAPLLLASEATSEVCAA